MNLEPTALQLAAWLAVAFFIAGGVEKILRITDRFKSKPAGELLEIGSQVLAKRVDTLEEGYTGLKESIVAYRSDIIADSDERRRAIYLKIEEQRLETKKDLQLISDKIGGISDNVAALQNNAQLVNTSMVQLSGKIDRIIERKH